jgi:hypothetical protein
LHLRPLGHKVREYLGLDHTVRSIHDILPHQLKCPLCNPSFGLGVLDDLPKWILGHDGDGMCIEVMLKLALGHHDGVHKFLHL